MHRNTIAEYGPAPSRCTPWSQNGTMSSMDRHAQSDQSNDEPNISNTQSKQCMECRALLPLSHFGLAKISTSGKAASCNQCKAQYLRLKRRIKYGSVSKVDDSILRNVSKHNDMILTQALSTTKYEGMAFHTVTKEEYKVQIGASQRTGLSSIAIFNLDGSLFYEYAFSGLKDPQPSVLRWVKGFGLRLEHSIVDVMASKNTIYYI